MDAALKAFADFAYSPKAEFSETQEQALTLHPTPGTYFTNTQLRKNLILALAFVVPAP